MSADKHSLALRRCFGKHHKIQKRFSHRGLRELRDKIIDKEKKDGGHGSTSSPQAGSINSPRVGSAGSSRAGGWVCLLGAISLTGLAHAKKRVGRKIDMRIYFLN